MFDASGRPLAGVEIVDTSTHTKAVTPESGAVSLAFLTAGTTILQIRKMGYESRTLSVVASATDTASITVHLKPVAQVLPEVATNAPAPVGGKLSEFERRRAAGFGRFITRDILETNRHKQTAEILLRMPGLVIIGTPSSGVVGAARGAQSFSGTSSLGGFCLAAVMLDGIPVFSGMPGEPYFNVNTIRPDEIAGIEYYASSARMPAEFNASRRTCGLVVIWTR